MHRLSRCLALLKNEAVTELSVTCMLPHARSMASTPRLPGAEAKPDLQQSPIVRPLVQDFPHSKYELIPPLEQRKPGPDSKRTGLIAIKVGMVSEWDEHGVLTPLTALWFDENQVCPPCGVQG